jgi:protein SCO1/2
MTLRHTRALAPVLLAAGLIASGCSRPAPAKQYPLKGQVIAVNPAQQHITLKHDDIPGLMPGMTMSFPVARPELLAGREPGELVTATLEVADAVGRITAIERVGFEALPDTSNAAAMAGSVLTVGDAVPDAAFLDQTNTRRSFAEWRGSVTLLTFIYTRCPLPNFCPLINEKFVKLQEAVTGDPALRGRIKLVTVSFDPDYDTPAVLAAEARRLGANPAVWTFLTGDRPTVDRFAAAMGVGLVRTTGEWEITHNLRTILIGADGRVAAIHSGNDWTVDAVLAGLRKAAAAARVP